MLTRIRFIALLAAAAASLLPGAGAPHWVASWGASPAPPLPDAQQMRDAKLVFAGQTLRQVVHLSIGGDTLRVRLSNAFGKSEVAIGAASIALRSKASAIAPGSLRALTFGGRSTVTIPPGAPVLSDPVKLTAPPAADLAISIYLPRYAAGAGIHYAAHQTSYIGPGDLTAAPAMPSDAATITSWVFLTGVDVLAPQNASAVVTFGDSITDGSRSTEDANRRWPNILAARLRARGGAPVGVLNAGIGGNRILHDGMSNVRFGVNALARFDRDVLAQAGVKYVVLMEGINDLGHPGSSAPLSETVTAEDIIAGMRQLIERAHQKGLKIFGATLTPFEGTVFPGYFSPEKEARRKAVNEWIRNGKAFDGVIDFDKAVRDPAHPDRIRAEFDGGDRLHPGDAGYQAMAEAVDLSLFQ